MKAVLHARGGSRKLGLVAPQRTLPLLTKPCLVSFVMSPRVTRLGLTFSWKRVVW